MARPIDEQQIAAWMLAEMDRLGGLIYQSIIVREIERRFGRSFTYTNKNGNPAIKKSVLDAFRALSGDNVVWVRPRRCWRRRDRIDGPRRLQGL